ncbi:hypothetical protein FJ250_08065, partial [bacterium]|nr:hypothetical protein [bacterium]
MNSFGSAPTGAGAAGRRSTRAASLVLCLLAVAVFLAACSDDPADPPLNQPPEPAARSWPLDVVGTSANDVYVCGMKGAMFRWNGTAWTAVDMQVGDPIVRMWKEDGGNTLYAVGHKGRIWRNAAGAWSPMASGTSENLYGIGALGGVVHAVGQGGVICRLTGSTWSLFGGRMFRLNELGAPVDTLLVAEDVASLVTVNHYFLGGAYFDPDYTEPRIGVYGTRGMVLAPNTDGDLDGEWILRPLSGEQTVPHEWVLATTSDPAVLGRNYLGTSEGWLFRLTRDDADRNVWSKFFPSLTTNPGSGINDIWVDAAGNVYLVTDEGRLVFQTVDYD